MSQLIQLNLRGEQYEPQEIKPYRWITLSEQQRYTEFLLQCGFDESHIQGNKLDWCASVVEKYKCQNHSCNDITVKYLLCGNRGFCVRCSMNYAHKRAGIMYKFLKENLADNLDFDLKMNQIVLTLPSKLHDMETKLFVKMIKKFMSKFSIESYGYCVQDTHSKDPLGPRYVHAHILTLNFKEDNGKMVQNDYYFDVDEMRKEWKAIIENMTNVKVEGNVNLKTEYHSVRNESQIIKHWLSYLYRYPIQDLFNIQIRKQSINYLETRQSQKSVNPINDSHNNILQIDDIKQKILNLISKPKSRIVWCGWLTSSKRERLLDMLAIKIQSIEDPEKLEIVPIIWKNMAEITREVESRASSCRGCMCPLEKEPYEIGEYVGDNEPDIR